MRQARLRRGGGATLSLALLAAVVLACSPAGTPPPAATALGAAGPVVLASTSPAGTTGALGPVSSPALTGDDAAAAYGQGATKDPAITYQPDVVFVGGGPASIRWAEGNGLVWAIDRNAPGAADLKVGSVMFATSTALGRVVAVEDQGDVRVVTLAPIELTDLIKDGDVQINQNVDLASVAYRQLPDSMPAVVPFDAGASASPSPSAGADADPSGRVITASLPAVRLAVAHPADVPMAAAAATTPAGQQLPKPAKACPELGVGDWSVETCLENAAGLSITVDRKIQAGLKFGFSLKLSSSSLNLKAGALIKDGQMVDSGGLLQGLDRLDLKFYGGVQDGAQDNVKVKVELPVEIEVQMPPTTGIPWKFVFETKFTVETAFSGKNSTLSGEATYGLQGGFGIVAGTPSTPVFTVQKSLLDSLSGITVGASGVVIAVKFKFQVGIGVPGFTAGPYLSLTFSLGVGQGSVIGSPLAECRGATFSISAAVGAGMGISLERLTWFHGEIPDAQKFLSLKLEFDMGQATLVNKKAVTPDVPLCRG